MSTPATPPQFTKPADVVPDSMVMTNTEQVPGYQVVDQYGMVSGSTVRAKHVGRDILAGFRNVFGGELRAYTELLGEARAEATRRMVAQAQGMGANGIINVRFATSGVAQGAAEIYVYGTAVRLERTGAPAQAPWG